MAPQQKRHIGLFSATSIGVGAIVGGSILALAGTGFAVAGPGVILAFLLNGLIAMITAFSFAELASANPQSGGTYSFARNTLTVGAAFGVGWVVWFASIVAAALYAIGFAAFTIQSIVALLPAPWPLLDDPRASVVLAVLSVVTCTAFLKRRPGSGGNLVNVLKVIVFATLIIGGGVVWMRTSPPAAERLTPFFSGGPAALATAMGFTFIAFQGFDLVAAVAGEVKEPRKNLPRAMFLSLGAAVCIYIPLLLIVAVVGVPEGSSIQSFSAKNPDTVIALAAREYLGVIGFWLVMASGILSMLSALLANLFAASRIARVMAGDRTLPVFVAGLDMRRGTPKRALDITGLLVALILLVIGDVARAGAASSLIFLISFALTHVVSILARKRQPEREGFRTPAWPYLPAAGAIICAALAVFQGIVVPEAGVIIAVWLILGFLSYLYIFGQRARTLDASSEYTDPDLLQLRGRSPLVLVPIANPVNAASLATLGICLAPRAGRIMMLNVVHPSQYSTEGNELEAMTQVLHRSMTIGLDAGVSRTEALISIAVDPWDEIARVARTHRCILTLLGMTNLHEPDLRERIEKLTTALPGNVVIVRAPEGWHPRQVRRILVPLGGRGVHNVLRARLLTALSHDIAGTRLHIQYVIVVPPATSEAERSRLQSMWTGLVTDESSIGGEVTVLPHHDVVASVVDLAEEADLIVLGLGQVGKRRVLGNTVIQITEQTRNAVIVIGQRI